MNFTYARSALLVGLIYAAGVTTCHSAVVSFSAIDSGWYSRYQFFPFVVEHSPNNVNYAAGEISRLSIRNFFVFDLSGLQVLDGQSVAAASLVLDTHLVGTRDVVETVEFFDVTSPIDNVINRVSAAIAVSTFNDLGTGVSYGTQLYSPSDSFTQKAIPLNSSAVENIRSAAGSRFAIGGALTTPSSDRLDNTELIFGDSGVGSSTIRLDLLIVPEPSTFAVAVSSVLALSLIRRRRPLKSCDAHGRQVSRVVRA